MIRALVVDDSATVRQLLVQVLSSDPEISVVGTAANGAEAVELVERLAPDLVVMDIYMPQMDGLEATREIMARSPTPILIVSSEANQHQLELSLTATQAGSLLVLPKPESPRSERFAELSEQLVRMAKAMAQVKVVRRWASPTKTAAPRLPRRRDATEPARLVAIAASTGGPAALRRILHELPREFPLPVLVVQHIARGFAPGLVDWLGAGCRLRVKVAEHGEVLAARTVYVAPDDQHLGVDGYGRIQLASAPPIGGFRPSASHLFESVARAYGAAAAAVVLTGMGDDGVAGLRSLYTAGGRVLGQDEGSSVVYGMAREAARSGVVDLLLPLEAIAPQLAALAKGGSR